MRQVNVIAAPPAVSAQSRGGLAVVCAVGVFVLLSSAGYLIATRGVAPATVITVAGLGGIIAALCAAAWPYIVNPPSRRQPTASTKWVHPLQFAAERQGRLDVAIRVYEGILQRAYSEDVAKRQAHLCVVLGRTQDAVRNYERLAYYYGTKLSPEPRKVFAVAKLVLKLDPENRWARRRARGGRVRPSAGPARRTDVVFNLPITGAQAVDLRHPLDDQEFISEHLAEGRVFLKYGLGDKAKDQFEAVLARFPENVEAARELKEIYRERQEKFNQTYGAQGRNLPPATVSALCGRCGHRLSARLGRWFKCPRCGQSYPPPHCTRCDAVLIREDLSEATVSSLWRGRRASDPVAMLGLPLCRTCRGSP
jgi:predicted RNA-binding Zn-ribbon protein involved in translation (DUF1610 family)